MVSGGNVYEFEVNGGIVPDTEINTAASQPVVKLACGQDAVGRPSGALGAIERADAGWALAPSSEALIGLRPSGWLTESYAPISERSAASINGARRAHVAHCNEALELCGRHK